MKLNLLSYLIFVLIFSSCSGTEKETTEKTEKNDTLVAVQDTIQDISKNEPCDFLYDTITSSQYKMHKLILTKFYHPEKRGYIMNSEGDTLNTFLYAQDISVFIEYLNPSEDEFHSRLTNKVIFLMIENDLINFNFRKTNPPSVKTQWKYFLEHVSHPICQNIPTKDLIQQTENIILNNELKEYHLLMDIYANLNKIKN